MCQCTEIKASTANFCDLGCLLWAAGPELHYVDICRLFNPLMPDWAGNWNCVIAASLTRWGKTLSQVDEGFVVTALLPQWARRRFLAGRRSLSLSVWCLFGSGPKFEDCWLARNHLSLVGQVLHTRRFVFLSLSLSVTTSLLSCSFAFLC